MTILLAIAGAVAGGMIDGIDGLLFGGVIGALVGAVLRLRSRIQAAERDLTTLKQKVAAGVTARDLEDRFEAREEVPPTPHPEQPRAAAEPPAVPRPPAEAAAPPPAKARAWKVPQEPDLFERAIGFAKQWATTGNVPVKVGVVVSLFGVAFLIKEAVNRQLLHFSVEMRLVSVALLGIGLLGLGWHLRERQRVYSLSVQGGGIAILYLTTFAAYSLYPLLPAGLAFTLLVALTAAAGALAVLQNSRAIAVLGIVGGFMAPVLVSTGSGNHVVLFSYYLVLNLAVLGIAWFRAWREFNLLGFIFTFAIASLWGYRAYEPAHFATTEPFLVTFFVFYAAIGVLFATRRPPKLKGFVDGTLVFGTPIIAFALQAQLVGDTDNGLAISALALAGFYVSLATVLYRSGSSSLRLLVESFLGIGVAFLTVAIPLALDARWTSAAWALQGTALIWIALRQRRRLALAAGAALQLAGGVSYFLQAPATAGALPIVNGHYLGAALIAMAGLIGSWLFDHDDEADRPLWRAAAWLLLGWGTAWWLGAGLAEIERHLAASLELSSSLVFVALSLGAAAYLTPRLDWPRLDTLGALLLPAMLIALFNAVLTQTHPLGNYGWLAWPLALAVQYAFLRYREEQLPARVAPVLHVGTYWLLAVALAWEVHWQVDRWAGGIWPTAAALATVALLVYASIASRERPGWPLSSHWRAYLAVAAGGVLSVVLISALGLNLYSPGDASPLPYIPLLNPLELASALTILVMLRWLSCARSEFDAGGRYNQIGHYLVAGFGFVILSMTVARAVHHWSGVPFELDDLARSGTLQAALSIVWSLTALTGMVLGARRPSRAVWVSGAILMGVVVIKLFLVELDNSGTVARIVSFIGVGALLLVVGYFAPVPPRVGRETAPAESA